MDGVREFLEDLKQHGPAHGNFLGVLHLLIGRRITKADGTVVSAGLTWRELAALLKKVRWDKDAVSELNVDPDKLPPRDRERYWYLVIVNAQVDSEAATRAGDRLAATLVKKGYVISPAPPRSKQPSRTTPKSSLQS